MLGMSYDTYQTIAEDFDRIWAATVVRTVLGVNDGDVSVVSVAESSTARRLSAATASTSTSSTMTALTRVVSPQLRSKGALSYDVVEVSYAISSHDEDARINNIVRNLQYTIFNGFFDVALHQDATDASVLPMTTIHSASLDITLPPEYADDDDSGSAASAMDPSTYFTDTVIIGLCVGGGGFILLIALSCVAAHYTKSDGKLGNKQICAFVSLILILCLPAFMFPVQTMMISITSPGSTEAECRNLNIDRWP